MTKRDHEQRFAEAWAATGLRGSDIERQFRFHETRRWRLDFAFPSQRLGVEIQGFGYGHQSQQGMSADAEKFNAATELGWRLLVYTTRQIQSQAGLDEAVEQVKRVLCGVADEL